MLTLTLQLQYYSSQPLNEWERGGGGEGRGVRGAEERRESRHTFQGRPFQGKEA